MGALAYRDVEDFPVVAEMPPASGAGSPRLLDRVRTAKGAAHEPPSGSAIRTTRHRRVRRRSACSTASSIIRGGPRRGSAAGWRNADDRTARVDHVQAM